MRKPKPLKAHVIGKKVGWRLRKLRQVYGWQEKQIARRIGVSPSSWTKYEKGQQIILPVKASKVLCETGATLDWIYLGTITAMPPILLRRIEAVTELANRFAFGIQRQRNDVRASGDAPIERRW